MDAAGKIRLQGAALWGVACALAYANVQMMSRTRTAVVYAHLGMTTHPARDGLALKWNPAQPPLEKADTAEMFIDDGSQHMRLVLSHGQLAVGELEYTPFSSDVRFRLIAHRPDGSATCESIRVLGNSEAGAADRTIPKRSGRGSEAGTVRMRVVSLEATQ
jgi:hypothetical protein